MERNNDILCSVGVLTYNSATTLERCLLSLRSFSEIIVADGGSTDGTVKIAKKYGCLIIMQSRQGTLIDDFALERNRMLDAARYDWFFYLDSDEIISDELKQEMRDICAQKRPPFMVYKVPYQLVSEDLATTYRPFKTYYQNRFFNKQSGARFSRKAHEKISFDTHAYAVGVLRGRWHVPLDTQLDFAAYRAKVERRIGIMADAWVPQSFGNFLHQALWSPLKNAAKQVMKMVYLRLRFRRDEIVPLRYEFFRLYSHYLCMRIYIQKYRRCLRT